MRKTFVVRLLQEEKEQLVALITGRKALTLKLMRAPSLLKADQVERGPEWTDTQIAGALEVSDRTDFNNRRK